MSSSLVFNRVYRLEIQTVTLVFSTPLVNSCPSTFSQEFNTLFLTRFRTYKIAPPPQTKTPVKTTFWNWCLYISFVHALYTRLTLRLITSPLATRFTPFLSVFPTCSLSSIPLFLWRWPSARPCPAAGGPGKEGRRTEGGGSRARDRHGRFTTISLHVQWTCTLHTRNQHHSTQDLSIGNLQTRNHTTDAEHTVYRKPDLYITWKMKLRGLVPSLPAFTRYKHHVDNHK
jgi:hypothetical protein